MIRIVAAKLLPYRSFSKFVMLHTLGILLILYVASRITSLGGPAEAIPIGDLFVMPQVWTTVTALSRWLFYVPAFFCIQLVCAELELKLARAQIIAGLERRDLIIGWVVQNAILVLIGIIATIIGGILLSKPGAGDFAQGMTTMLRQELGFAIYGLCFLNFAVLGALLLRRPIPSVTIILLWPIVIEPLLSFALNHYGFESVSNYLPFACLGTLTPWPGTMASFDPVAPTTFAAIAYGVLAAALSWVRLSRLDL